MRLIDADAFDRALANHEFSAALNEAASNDRVFEDIPMLYSTQSFRDVMSYRPTIDAIPVSWICGLIRDEENTRNYKTAQYLTNMIWEWHQQEDEEREARV